MKKFFSTLFVALMLTVTAVSPAFAQGPAGPASIGRPAPAELAPAELEATDEVICHYGRATRRPGEKYYRGRFRKTLICQPDGTWDTEKEKKP